jgi:hypothetical protein
MEYAPNAQWDGTLAQIRFAIKLMTIAVSGVRMVVVKNVMEAM